MNLHSKTGSSIVKAAYIEKVGAPDVIRIGVLPIPAISVSEVLVKISTTTVNHVDCYIRSGKYRQELPSPFIIGRDCCGEVVQVGSNVNEFKIGDRVWSNCLGIQGRQGTFAEYVAVPPEALFHLPENTDPLQAVALFHSAFTAILGLTREAELKPGDVLYVHGAAGNIGAALIQVAKSYGAHVIASTHGEEKAEYCRQLGADEVLDYREDLVQPLTRFAPQGINVFWNTSRHHDFKTSLSLLAKKGRYILMAGSGAEAVLPIGDLYTKDASIRGFAITNASLEETKQAAHKINDLLKKRLLSVKIDQIMPLEAAQQAHELMEQDAIWGKIVIDLR
jgi:NADPH2:quinone reductase